MVLNNDIIDLLAEQSSKKKLITGQYLTDPNNDNFQYIKRKFFPLEPVNKVTTLVSGSGLFESVSNTIAFYVGNPTTQFNFPTQQLVKDFLVLGFATFWLERVDWQLQVVYMPAENYIKLNGIDHIIRSYEYELKGNTTYYYLVTSYDGGIIENKLYETDTLDLSDSREVPLDTLDETSNLLERVDTGLEQAFWKIQEDELDQSPVSLIDQIKQVVYSIDRNIVMFDTQFLQNVESFVLMKGINLPTKLISKYNEHWKIDFSDLGRYITTDEDGKIEFVNNENQQLQQAINYEDKRIQRVSSITNVPMDFLWGTGTAGAIGQGSRELLHGSFIKRILSIREMFDEYIKEVLDIFVREDSSMKDSYSWDDVFSKNTRELIEELEKALNIGLISKRTALKRYLSLDDSEIDIEFALMDNEALPVIEDNVEED